MEDQVQSRSTSDENHPHSSTSLIFKKFQKLYAKQLKEADESSGGLKLKIKILENWVEDLTEQNVMLVKTVDDLESEALKRLCTLEANLSQGQETTAADCISGKISQVSKGLNGQIETLCQELEQMKRQLTDKENLISKYQSRIEELGSSIEEEKTDDCNKVLENYFSKASKICDQDHNVQPSVYREETLAEVLGIKERSLTHLEQLTEQLERKDQVISCLKQQLTQGSSDLVYRVRQQLDWFTENVTQQCSQGNCSEEFKKCITTMLEELKESIECCNLGPSDATELSKDSIKFVSSIQKSLEKSKKDLCHSWNSISETVHQMNKIELSPLVDQWKKGLCKQKSLQQKLQEAVRSIINDTACSSGNVESITKSMDSLQCLLFRFTDELNSQPRGRSFTGWLKNLHCVVTELISKIQQITKIISDIRSSDDETHADLVSKIQLVDSLQWELNEALCTELNAYETLCRSEKAQRIKVDSLLATVLHHQEIWNQQVTLTDDLMKEILRLTNNLTLNPVNSQAKQISFEEKSTHLQCLVSKISADIRKSLCDIEQRQNQVSHLELDLSSVKLVLESAQQEIEDISKSCDTHDVRRKVTVLLLKLTKQITNALTKANNLVKTYSNTKQEFICSSERILQLQKEWQTLEQEVRQHWTQLSKDFKKPPKSKCGVCPNQTILETYEQKLCGKPLLRQYKCLQKALQKEDAAIKKVKGNVMDLKLNIKDRDKLSETQDKTICILQNSLKKCNNEAEELRKTINCLEIKKCEIEIESKNKIRELECKITKLQNCLKKYDEANKKFQKNEEALKLVIANLKENSAQDKKVGSLENSLRASQNEVERLSQIIKCLELKNAETEKECKEHIQKLQNKVCELQNNMKQSQDTTLKHHKSEAALQLVIANLKETISKERKKCCDTEKENSKLREQMRELEDCTKNASQSNMDTLEKLAELKKQVKCWSKKAADLEDQLNNVQEKLCKSLQHENELEQELSSKDLKCKEEICKKEKEINELTKAVQSLTERVNQSRADSEAARMKICETELKWQSVCTAYEELKLKEREREAQVEKLQLALTQLSNKFVSRRLDTGTSQCLRHYQEECAKYEALYNTSSCKLRSKELEVTALKQELERLRCELDQAAVASSQLKEEESCPFLMERVHQLSKELQVSHSCQNSYEAMLKDIREKLSKKEEENFHLKTQVKQLTLQRDTVLSDFEEAQQEIERQQTLIKRLEQNNAHVSEQLHKAVYESEHSAAAHLQPNIEVQREISTALTSQLRVIKQKLHNTKQDYKLLQTAYEDLNRKYSTLQRGERDLEQVKAATPATKPEIRCRPCLAKSSKSVTYIKMPERMGGQNHVDSLAQSKSWHKMDDKNDLDWKERRWKRKLQEVIRGDLDPSVAAQYSSSSN